MSVLVDTLAGRAGTVLRQGAAAIGFRIPGSRSPRACDVHPTGSVGRPVPRGPAIDPSIMAQLEEAARTAGKLGWSRRYAEIVLAAEDRH